jgi:hypothetical protein
MLVYQGELTKGEERIFRKELTPTEKGPGLGTASPLLDSTPYSWAAASTRVK